MNSVHRLPDRDHFLSRDAMGQFFAGNSPNSARLTLNPQFRTEIGGKVPALAQITIHQVQFLQR